MNRPGRDGSANVEQVAPRTCNRRMTPGMVKRYPAAGPLLGYFICCPGCGNTTPHVPASEHALIELDGKLFECSEELTCTICDRVLTVSSGVITATLPKAP